MEREEVPAAAEDLLEAGVPLELVKAESATGSSVWVPAARAL